MAVVNSYGMVELSERDLRECNGGAVTITTFAIIAGIGLAVSAVKVAYEKGKKVGYEEQDLEYDN